MPNPRFPTPPQVNQSAILSFPEDKKDFYASFEFATYNSFDFLTNDLFGGNSVYSPNLKTTKTESLILPIPKKINDATTLTWNEESLLSKALSLADSTGIASATVSAAQAVSPLTGFTLNPFLFMQFQRNNFKEFVFQWTFTPNSVEESIKIKGIVKAFQKAALPTKIAGALLKYPNVVDIKFYPDNLFGMMKMKTCAIVSVQVDYTGAGQPSFFKKQQNQSKGGAPVVTNLSVSLKEIELWYSTDIGEY